jgi:hypothetical protein
MVVDIYCTLVATNIDSMKLKLLGRKEGQSVRALESCDPVKFGVSSFHEARCYWQDHVEVVLLDALNALAPGP